MVGASNGAGIHRQSLAMLPEEAEVGAVGDEDVQKASPDSSTVVVAEGVGDLRFLVIHTNHFSLWYEWLRLFRLM